jgi:hypothetical protein
MIAWLLQIACGGSAAGTDDGLPTTGSTPTETTATATPTPAADDAALARAIIAGEAGLDALHTLAYRGGLPVQTEAGFLFLWAGDEAGWALAGSWDDWTPAPLTAGAPGVWWAEVPLTDAAGAQYKFTRGADWVADPWARAYTHDDFGEISYVRPPTDRWRLDRWPDLAGSGVEARDLAVYVPAGAGPFPVLYAQDGQNLFDPAAIWGGWRLPDALAEATPMIVVGVFNTPARMDDYTHVPDDLYGYPIGGAGDAYAAFLHDDVRPLIDGTYATSGHDGLLGSSLGGLIALHTAALYPDDYDFVASLSGTLGWGRFGLANPVMEERWLALPPAAVPVYVDSGGGPGDDGGCVDRDGDGFPEDDPDDADNYCTNRQFVDALAAAGWTWDADLWHWWTPDAPHNEAAWGDRVALPLAQFGALAAAPPPVRR